MPVDRVDGELEDVGRRPSNRPTSRDIAAATMSVPIQLVCSFLSDREKPCIAGIPTATYTANVHAGKSVTSI
jgi:hypothetical protein